MLGRFGPEAMCLSAPVVAVEVVVGMEVEQDITLVVRQAPATTLDRMCQAARLLQLAMGESPYLGL